MRNFFSSQNKKVLLTLAVALLILVPVVIFTITNSDKPSTITKNQPPSPSASIKPSSSSLIKSITPEEARTLIAGSPQVFSIILASPIDLDQIEIQLQASLASEDLPPQPVVIRTAQINPSSITVSTVGPIEPNAAYDLTLENKKTGEIISLTYLSSDVIPTPIPSNNTVLKQYLPHETGKYLLYFLSERNIYVFNYKYDPDSDKTIEEQIEDAKEQANDFIKSKGINLSSLTIEYENN